MNVLIYGYGLYEGGYSPASYFVKKGHKVRITDLREEKDMGESIQKLKASGVEIIAGAHRVEDFKWADIVIKTPAISPDNPFLAYSKNVTSEYAYLFENENVAKTKLVFITGKRSKTITSEALCRALNTLGNKARICGSIEASVFTELENWEKGDIPDYLICKMTAWQIRDTYRYSGGFIPQAEILTVTSPVFNEKYANLSSNIKYILCPTELRQELKEQLNVNLRKISQIENNKTGMSQDLPENLSISYAIMKRLGFKPSEINKALKSFKGIPHRMEIVSTNEGLLVVNNSVATIPEAVALSLQNFKNNPVHLLCGGANASLCAEPMHDALKAVASIYLLDGSFTKEKLIPYLNNQNIPYFGPFNTVEDATVAFKSNFIESKNMLQVLLLSPGAPSNEFYLNEFDRGNHFRNCFK